MRTSRLAGIKFLRSITVAALLAGAGCGGDKKDAAPAVEAAIAGTVSLDPALKDKAGKTPLLMIIASASAEPNKPAVVVKRVAEASFPYAYKLTAEDITLVGTQFTGNLYVSARIDPAGTVGAPGPGTLEGVYQKNPAAVGSANVDIVIDKAY